MGPLNAARWTDWLPQVWRSTVGDYFNMLCSFAQGKSWARFTSTSASLLTWRLAEREFTKPNIVGGGGGALFHAIPNAPPGGPTHLINGNTGSEFFLGNYDSTLEVMNLTSRTPQKVDSGTLYDWAAAGSASDGRLLLIGKVDGDPGAGRSYGSLIRELLAGVGASRQTQWHTTMFCWWPLGPVYRMAAAHRA